MKKPLRIAIPILIAAAAAVLIYTRFFSDSVDDNLLKISGNIEVTQVPLAFKISGRLAARLVDEGGRIKRGQPAARLESADQEIAVARAESELARVGAMLAELEAGSRPQEIRQAEAQLRQARFYLAKLETGSRPQEIADARAELNRAQAAASKTEVEYEQAKADYDRFAALFKQGGISRHDFERYQTRYKSAENVRTEARAGVESIRQKLSLIREGPRAETIAEARAALDQAEAACALIKAGPRKETIDAARAQKAAAREALNLARRQLTDTEIKAPLDGVILSKSAEPGAYLSPGMPVVTIGDLDHPWLRAYVSETRMGRLQLNQQVAVITDAFPNERFPGRISFISSEAEFTPKSVQTFEERVKLMYRIKIDLANPDHRLKPGMPADAVIELEN